jgi:hypothetical protein
MPNGSVNPNTAPIQQSGNIYALTDNVYGCIKILKSNVVLDGAGHTITGSFNGNSSDIWVIGNGPSTNLSTYSYYTIGLDLGNSSIEGVTVENLNVENFSIGMYIWTQNNTIIGNGISGNILGLLLSGSNATITKNYISDNIEGLFFGFTPVGTFPPDMVVYQNAFVKNNVQLSGCQCKVYNLSEATHYWDNGKIGNYWSNYNGTSPNPDGIGDTPYMIDTLDMDRFPLVQSPVNPPSVTPKFPFETIALGVLVPVVLVAAIFAVSRRRKHEVPK